MVSFSRVAELTSENIPAALCTVTETSGSTPRKAGARMIVIADGSERGRIEGTIGGGAIEHRIRADAIRVIAESQAQQIRVALTNELGMCCGGQMTVFIEPLRQKPPCIIFGAGHIGEALTRFAAQSGFAVTVADPRHNQLIFERLPLAACLIEDYTPVDLAKMPFGPDAFVVVVTHCHETDQRLAEEVLQREFRYAALVGSKRKAALTKQRCGNKGILAEQINRLRSPAGIDIGAQTPEEIALSIVAEMIAIRRSSPQTAPRKLPHRPDESQIEIVPIHSQNQEQSRLM